MLLNLTCTACGASLGIPDGTAFVTCAHCGTRLAVREGEGAKYTEVLEEVDRRTGRIEVGVETLRLQNELAQLDREWEMSQAGSGSPGNPSMGSPALGIGTVIVGLILFVGFVGSMGMQSAATPGFFGQGRGITLKEGQTLQQAIDSAPDGYFFGPSMEEVQRKADSQFQFAAAFVILVALLAGGVWLFSFLRQDEARQNYEDRRAKLLERIDSTE